MKRNKTIKLCALVTVVCAALLYLTVPTIIAHRFIKDKPDYKIKPPTALSILTGRRDLYQFEMIDGKESWVADFSATLRGVIFEECSFWMLDIQGRIK